MMKDEKEPLSPGQSCVLVVFLVLLGCIFGLLWVGIMMGDPKPGVHMNRTMGIVYFPMTFVCWSGALAVIERAFKTKK